MDTKLENMLARDIAQRTIEKLACLGLTKMAAPKIMSAVSKAAKPASAGAIGSKLNLQGSKPNLASPTGRAVAQPAIKTPTVASPVLNDQITSGANLQAAGFRPQFPMMNMVSSGGTPMMPSV